MSLAIKTIISAIAVAVGAVFVLSLNPLNAIAADGEQLRNVSPNLGIQFRQDGKLLPINVTTVHGRKTLEVEVRNRMFELMVPSGHFRAWKARGWNALQITIVEDQKLLAHLAVGKPRRLSKIFAPATGMAVAKPTQYMTLTLTTEDDRASGIFGHNYLDEEWFFERENGYHVVMLNDIHARYSDPYYRDRKTFEPGNVYDLAMYMNIHPDPAAPPPSGETREQKRMRGFKLSDDDVLRADEIDFVRMRIIP
jgi:hypothetical protein